MMLTICREKKHNGKCARMLRAILNKSWKQHLKQLLYGHLPPVSKTIQIRRTRSVEHCWKIHVTFSYGPLHMDVPVLADQQEPTYNSSVRTQDVVWITCRERWMIGTNGARELRISVLAA